MEFKDALLSAFAIAKPTIKNIAMSADIQPVVLSKALRGKRKLRQNNARAVNDAMLCVICNEVERRQKEIESLTAAGIRMIEAYNEQYANEENVNADE